MAVTPKGRSLWPIWFPSPRIWWHTLVLTVLGMGSGLVLFLMEMWRWLIVAAIAQEGIFIVFGLGALVLALIWYWSILGIYALVLRIFWSKPPQWLRPSKGRARLIDLFIMAVGILPGTLRLWPFFFNSDMLIESLEWSLGSFDQTFDWVFIAWFPVVAYLQHLPILIGSQKATVSSSNNP